MLHANQLMFNLDVPTDLNNMQTRFSSPSAIVFERILPRETPSERERNRSLVKLSAVSSARLSKALQLAKRDVRLAKRKNTLHDFAKENEMDWQSSNAETPSKDQSKTAFCLLPVGRTNLKYERTPKVRKPLSKRSSPQKLSKDDQEMIDIRRLKLELNQIVLKLEQNIEDQRELHSHKLLSLDQEEEQRLVVRHLEQMRKSSRTVYTLQQQTQVIKDDLKRSNKQKADASTKGRTLGRLAAVHRGTVRLFQEYSKQLPEHLIFNDNFVAVNALYQEVSRLIKELSLCSLQFDLTNVEDVERITDALKNIEPKYTQPPRRASSPKGRWGRTPQKLPRTPKRAFKTKKFDVIKKSPVRSKFPRSSTPTIPTQRLQEETSPQRDNADIFDRPEWRPPSNSPHKNVGPPSLSPLLESPAPMPRRQLKPKQVTFFSTLRDKPVTERDTDAFQQSSPRDLKMLKSRIADELEAEVKNRINPLLKKVEDLAKSAQVGKKASKRIAPEEEILERQVREIIDETKKEMEYFQKKNEVEDEAVHLYQGPSLESLMLRLNTISNEEETIRRRWKEINYEDTRPKSPALRKSDLQRTPQPIKFTKTSSLYPEDPSKRIFNFLPKEDGENGQKVIFSTAREKEEAFSGRTVTLPQSTLNAIKKNRRDFERHLKFTFHEAKGRFDPWKLVEELSDDVLDEVVTSVSKEVNGLCEDYANDIFQLEFANASLSSERSMVTTESSSSVVVTPSRKL